MSAALIHPSRLELCRIVREHCYQAEMPMMTVPGDGYIVRLAQATLEVPIETMAAWFMLDETVMANMRLAMTMVQQTMSDDDRDLLSRLLH